MSVFALHGFLGQASDWDFLQPHFSIETPSLFAPDAPPATSLAQWASEWTSALPPGQHVLLGYSLGGRLALHALLHAPARFRAAILISTHPGLSTEAERAERRERDAVWARRFMNDPWADVVGAWEDQPVFGQTNRVARREDSYSRESLRGALLGWSLGTQKDLRPELAELPPTLPLIWVAGARDGKFARLAEDASAIRGEARIVAEAGHRVPWDRPDALCAILEEFN